MMKKKENIFYCQQEKPKTLIKDEIGGKIITKCAAIRPKAYACKIKKNEYVSKNKWS